MSQQRTVLVVILTVRRQAVAEFELFEKRAAAVMSRHGGRIERVVRSGEGDQENTFREVHVVSFPDDVSFDAYRRDLELAALRSLREQSIVSTEIIRGSEREAYGSGG
jgi:hypothetical protein